MTAHTGPYSPRPEHALTGAPVTDITACLLLLLSYGYVPALVGVRDGVQVRNFFPNSGIWWEHSGMRQDKPHWGL